MTGEHTWEQFRRLFSLLGTAYDFDTWHWQPETGPDYICVSAVLVQHTSWRNVERALDRLDAAGVCSLAAIGHLAEQELASLIRPAGTQRMKARRLRSLARLASEHNGLRSLLSLPADDLRPLLLATHGIGPETADAILLYAAGHAVFQIDAYTVRIMRRLGLGPENDGYEDWQRWFQQALPADVDAYRRAHALFVLHGKERCRPQPRCDGCCLLEVCTTGQERRGLSRTSRRASIPTRC